MCGLLICHGVYLQIETIVFSGPLILIMHVLRLHVDWTNLELKQHHQSRQWQHHSHLSLPTTFIMEYVIVINPGILFKIYVNAIKTTWYVFLQKKFQKLFLITVCHNFYWWIAYTPHKTTHWPQVGLEKVAWNKSKKKIELMHMMSKWHHGIKDYTK